MKSFYILIILLTISTFAFAQSEFLDSTFSDDGIFTQEGTTGSLYNLPNSTILIQPDNKILYARSLYYSGESTIRRLNENGSIDSTFAENGIIINPSSNFDDIAFQSDYKIIWLQNTDSTFTLQRLHSDGNVDSTFGNNGIVHFPVLTTQTIASTITTIKNVLIQDDDKILVGGNVNYGSLLMRFTANGQVDSTFGNHGQMDIDFGQNQEWIYNFEIQPNGKIIIIGEYSGDIFIARLNTNGTLDNTFGTNGKTIVPYSYYERARKIKFQSDGSIIIAAWSYDYTPMNERSYNLLLRFSENGQLDNTFGDNGITVTNSLFNGEGSNDNLLIQSDDKIILCGSGGRIYRFHADGQEDYNFGIGGQIKIELIPYFNYVESIQLQTDDKFIISGHSGHSSNNPTNFIARLKPLQELLNNDTIPVDTIITNPIDTSLIDFNLNIFPNPIETEGFITYELTEQSNINCYVLNGLGQIVQVIKQNEPKDAGKYLESITIQELPRRSVYYLWLDDGKRHVVRPFLLKEK